MASDKPVIPTAEELRALQERAAMADTLQAKLAEKEGELTAISTDENVINWKRARDKEKRLTEALKAAGKALDADGNVIESRKELTDEEIEERFDRIAVTRSVAREARNLPEDQRELFQKFYEKASYGEKVSAENVDQFIESAKGMISPGERPTAGDRLGGTRGSPPSMPGLSQGMDFSETDSGKALGAKLGFNIE
jgi:hypothetical protein